MVRRHGSESPGSCESTIGNFDAQVSFEQPAACEQAAVDIPDAIVDIFAADIFASAGV